MGIGAISKVCGKAGGPSTNRHFLGPSGTATELFKEYAFGVLHAPCGIGVAKDGGDGFERRD